MTQENNAFPPKWDKKLPPEFKDMLNSADAETVKRKIVECESNIYTIDKEKDNDNKLTSARETVKEFSAPYRDAKKTQEAKVKYCLWLLESRGEDLGNKE